jgi:peptidoglycan/LPS O-acetylase OafA/YrhL
VIDSLLTLEAPATLSAPATAQAAPDPRKPPMPALTGIRTLFAVNIMFFHFTPPHMRYLYPVINNSYVFMRFFFLLSGFVLFYNYADRPRLVKRDFWRARFARLYPVYLLSLAVSFMMLEAEWQTHSHAAFWTGVALTPFLLQGWSPMLATFWNTVAWTVSCDVVLYAAFPWLIRLPWPRTPARLVAMLLGVWAIGLVPNTLYLALNPDHLAAPADRYTYAFWIRALKYTPLSYVCTFLAGITLGKLHTHLTLSRRQRTAITAASLIALAAFFATAISRVPYVLMHGGLLVPLFCALVLGLSGPNPIAAVFAWPPLVLLGQTSYCLYLLHFNLINLMRTYRVPQRLHLGALDPWITYATAMLVAFAATRLVEIPARRAILRRPATPGR